MLHFQTWIANDFPSEVLIGLISCIFETTVAAIVTFIAENDSSVWTLSIRIQWISILLGVIFHLFNFFLFTNTSDLNLSILRHESS